MRLIVTCTEVGFPQAKIMSRMWFAYKDKNNHYISDYLSIYLFFRFLNMFYGSHITYSKRYCIPNIFFNVFTGLKKTYSKRYRAPNIFFTIFSTTFSSPFPTEKKIIEYIWWDTIYFSTSFSILSANPFQLRKIYRKTYYRMNIFSNMFHLLI